MTSPMRRPAVPSLRSPPMPQRPNPQSPVRVHLSTAGHRRGGGCGEHAGRTGRRFFTTLPMPSRRSCHGRHPRPRSAAGRSAEHRGRDPAIRMGARTARADRPRDDADDGDGAGAGAARADGRPTRKGSGRDCADGHRDPGKDRRSTTEHIETREPNVGDRSTTESRASRSDENSVSVISVVKRWGLRTLGELAALPSSELSARLGQQGLDLAGHRARAGCRAARADAGRRAIRVVHRAGVAY